MNHKWFTREWIGYFLPMNYAKRVNEYYFTFKISTLGRNVGDKLAFRQTLLYVLYYTMYILYLRIYLLIIFSILFTRFVDNNAEHKKKNSTRDNVLCVF